MKMKIKRIAIYVQCMYVDMYFIIELFFFVEFPRFNPDMSHVFKPFPSLECDGSSPSKGLIIKRA